MYNIACFWKPTADDARVNGQFFSNGRQEIEAAVKKKRKRGKSAAPGNESDEFQESENEYNTDDYENSVGFL
jgi:hypothetical protein